MARDKSGRTATPAPRAKRRAGLGGKNRFGLTRAIPETVARQVRQECFFGCVLCGELPVEYDHFAPEFRDAQEHAPSGIALLCTAHHRDKSSGRLSAQAVAEGRRNPWCRTRDPIWPRFYWPEAGALKFGGLQVHGRAVGGRLGLCVQGRPVLELRPPDEQGRPWILTGSLSGPTGNEVLTIEDNMVLLRRGNWDVTFEGQTLVVKEAKRKIVAELRFSAHERLIEVSRLQMALPGGHELRATSEMLSVFGPKVKFSFGADPRSDNVKKVTLATDPPTELPVKCEGYVDILKQFNVGGAAVQVMGVPIGGPGIDAIVDFSSPAFASGHDR